MGQVFNCMASLLEVNQIIETVNYYNRKLTLKGTYFIITNNITSDKV